MEPPPNQPPAAAGRPLPFWIARLALAVEKFVLPWLYAYFACRGVIEMRQDFAVYHLRVAVGVAEPAGQFYANETFSLLLFVLMVFTGTTLLLSRRPTALPDRLRHIVVPLVMSYYFFLYPQVSHLPTVLSNSLLPERFAVPCALVALGFSIVGYSISIWALAHLRRSFALLVAVRKVVSTGPYARVRHPIYLGYLLDLCGIVLANPCPGMMILAAGFVTLMVFRARMEEAKLNQASASYREYMGRTGFLFPRWRSAGPVARPK